MVNKAHCIGIKFLTQKMAHPKPWPWWLGATLWGSLAWLVKLFHRGRMPQQLTKGGLKRRFGPTHLGVLDGDWKNNGTRRLLLLLGLFLKGRLKGFHLCNVIVTIFLSKNKTVHLTSPLFFIMNYLTFPPFSCSI